MTNRFHYITTPWTDIFLAQRGNPAVRAQCLELLAEKYREPIRAFIESSPDIQPDKADDLVHGYFAKFLEKGFLDRLDQSRGRLRDFFMATVRNYVRDEIDKGKAGASYNVFAKHHGLPAGENMPDPAARPPDEGCMIAWARKLMNEAVEAFRLACEDHGKPDYLAVFTRHVLDSASFGNPSYEDTAKALGMTVKRVENCRANAVKHFRKILRAKIRETVADDSQVEEEMMTLRKYFVL